MVTLLVTGHHVSIVVLAHVNSFVGQGSSFIQIFTGSLMILTRKSHLCNKSLVALFPTAIQLNPQLLISLGYRAIYVGRSPMVSPDRLSDKKFAAAIHRPFEIHTTTG